jgi:ABC-type multidrug transport system ATPase subunit
VFAIVLAFIHDPDLLIMDEPTSGPDPLKREQFLEFIHAERARGKTFLFSSHILSEVRKVCGRVGIIREGRLVELEDVQSLLDLSIEEASLEDVFMRFYGGDPAEEVERLENADEEREMGAPQCLRRPASRPNAACPGRSSWPSASRRSRR